MQNSVSKIKVRHYGAKKYKPELFKKIIDRRFSFINKPLGGLYTSPITSEWGWKDWCEEENFKDCTDYFDLEVKGKILVINKESDLELLPWFEYKGIQVISFEELISKGYVAIYLTAEGERKTRNTGGINMYGWDCETVLILNPICITVLSAKKN